MKKIITSVTAALLLMTGPSMTQAKELKSGYPFCLTEQAWDQLTTAMAEEDTRMMGYLERKGLCGILKSGLEYSLVDRTWTGTAKVRVWINGEPVMAWTNAEATM